jgi:hypothetical protein
MKFDQQNMMKNRFWILLGGFGFFFFIAFSVLVFGNAINDTDYNKAKKDLQSSKNPKHRETYVPPWKKQTADFKTYKEKAWEQAWNYQKGLLTWPGKGLRDRWENGAGKDTKSWADAQQADPNSLFPDMRNYVERYPDQFNALYNKDYNIVAPAEFYNGRLGFEAWMTPAVGSDSSGGKGGGMGPPTMPSGVGGGRPGSGSTGSGRSIASVFKQDPPPSLEEAWIGQEDFCIKREFLKAIAATIDSAARLNPGPAGFWQLVTSDEPTPSADVKTYRCHNNHWELNLVIIKDPDGGWKLSREKSTLKNVDIEQRKLNVSSIPDTLNPSGMLQFRVYRQTGKDSLLIEVQSEAREFGSDPISLSTQLKTDDDQPRPGKEKEDSAPADIKNFPPPEDIKEIKQVLEWETSPIRTIEELRVPALAQRQADLTLKPGLSFVEKKEAQAESAGSAPASSTFSRGGGSTAPGGGGRTADPNAPVSVTPINGLDRLRYLHVTEQSRHVPFGIALIVEKSAVPDVLAALANTSLRIQITQVDQQRVRGVASARDAAKRAMVSTREDDANLVELVIYGICTVYERVPEKTEKPK